MYKFELIAVTYHLILMIKAKISKGPFITINTFGRPN